MTEREVIKYFKDANRTNNMVCVLPKSDIGKCVINALEKQIPKKPTLEADGYSDGQLIYDTWICPYCEKRYETEYDNYDYCPNCGQAIDWSDWNEL